jgi:hypothetical protein
LIFPLRPLWPHLAVFAFLYLFNFCTLYVTESLLCQGTVQVE